MSISPRSRESLWQHNKLHSASLSQDDSFWQVLSTPTNIQAKSSFFFLLFNLTNSPLFFFFLGGQESTCAAELHQSFCEHMVMCVCVCPPPPPGPKSLLDPDGEVNIVECLIPYTCRDYFPFDIRYALVKWALTAFPLQSRIQHVSTYARAQTSTSTCAN